MWITRSKRFMWNRHHKHAYFKKLYPEKWRGQLLRTLVALYCSFWKLCHAIDGSYQVTIHSYIDLTIVYARVPTPHPHISVDTIWFSIPRTNLCVIVLTLHWIEFYGKMQHVPDKPCETGSTPARRINFHSVGNHNIQI